MIQTFIGKSASPYIQLPPCQEESGSVAKRTPVPDCEKVINYIKMVLYIRLTNRWKYTSPRCMALIDSVYAQTAIKFISCQCICLRVIKLGNSSKLWERKCCTRNCGIKIWESLRNGLCITVIRIIYRRNLYVIIRDKSGVTTILSFILIWVVLFLIIATCLSWQMIWEGNIPNLLLLK